MLSSIHIGGAGTWDTGTAIQVHLGYGPIGILKTDNQNGWDSNGNPVYTGGTPSTKSGITGCDFMGLYFEAVSNCCFLDISTGNTGSIYSTNWRSTGHSWSSQFLVTLPPVDNAAYQRAWAMLGRGADDVMIDGGENPPSAGSVGTYDFGGGWLKLRLGGLPEPNLIGSGSSWGAPEGSVTVEMVQNPASGVAGTASRGRVPARSMPATSSSSYRAAGAPCGGRPAPTRSSGSQ
jgi:hypothetical protein